jgi:hypothetical protein
MIIPHFTLNFTLIWFIMMISIRFLKLQPKEFLNPRTQCQNTTLILYFFLFFSIISWKTHTSIIHIQLYSYLNINNKKKVFLNSNSYCFSISLMKQQINIEMIRKWWSDRYLLIEKLVNVYIVFFNIYINNILINTSFYIIRSCKQQSRIKTISWEWMDKYNLMWYRL